MEFKYPNLMSPKRYGRHLLKSHIIATSMLPSFIQANEPYPTDEVIAFYTDIAKAGAAILDVNATMHVGTPHEPTYDLNDPKNTHYMSMLADSVHYYNTKILCMANSEIENFGPCDVSANIPVENISGEGVVRGGTNRTEMDKAYMQRIIDDYVKQCLAFKSCGIDGVNVHMGYRLGIPGRFFSPLINKRTDEFGGSTENRCRFPLWLCKSIKEACGQDFLIEVKITGDENRPGGSTIKDLGIFAKLGEGIVDIIQIAASDIDPQSTTNFEADHQPFRKQARELREIIKANGGTVMVNSVCGYDDPDIAEETLAQGDADMIGIARAFIADPEFGYKIAEGHSDDIVPCLRCNKCHYYNATEPWSSVCSVNPLFNLSHKKDYYVRKTPAGKKVAIVGGGPAGMRCAIELLKKGQIPVIFEKEDHLGGLLNAAGVPDFKWTIERFNNYLIHEIKKNNVEVRLNTKATQEMLEAENFDEVVIAIGADPIVLPIPGADGGNVVQCTDAFLKPENVKGDVVIIGGGEVGMEAAIFFARKGQKVTVLEMADKIAPNVTPIHYGSIFTAAWQNEKLINPVVQAKATRITAEGVYYEKDGKEELAAGQSVIMSVGLKSRQDEALALCKPGRKLRMIGDCYKVGDILKANRSAFFTAMDI